MKYTIAGIALLGLFVLMVTPMATDNMQTQALHYGSAYVVAYDTVGNERFTQNIHNDLVDQGENYILTQIFGESGNVAFAEIEQMAAICITGEGSFTETEGETASSFDTGIILTGSKCVFGEAVITNSAGVQKAVIGPLTFAVTANLANAETITGIGICQADNGTNSPFEDCEAGSAGTGVILAVVNVSDIQVATSESVSITYTLDLSSIGS